MKKFFKLSLSATLLVLGLLVLAGCTGHIMPETDDDPVKSGANPRFTIVTASENDTFESLARTHLKDKRQGWRIAAYNQTGAIKKGQRLIIPKVPFRPGGLTVDGYQTVPILTYLDMAVTPKRTETISARGFERQLAYLSENGFTAVSLNQLSAFLNLRGDLPAQSIVITMDTTRGWAFDLAYPLLKKYEMRGALFFSPRQVGQQGNLTWQQLAEMAANGIDMGLYGTALEAPAKESLADYLKTYEADLAGPKKLFPKRLKLPCRYFAFASGKSDDLTIALLKKHGYRAGFTRQRGSNPFFTDAFALKRSVIYGHYDMQKFRRNLTAFRSMELR